MNKNEKDNINEVIRTIGSWILLFCLSGAALFCAFNGKEDIAGGLTLAAFILFFNMD